LGPGGRRFESYRPDHFVDGTTSWSLWTAIASFWPLDNYYFRFRKHMSLNAECIVEAEAGFLIEGHKSPEPKNHQI